MEKREYTNAVGRRKETTATVKLYAKGAGNIVVRTATGKEYTLADYFGGNVYLYKNAVLPFTTLGADVLKKFDAEIKVVGGGIAGQSDAIKLAFARALVEWNADLRPTLKPHGLLKRDPRIKERKKPGLKKARKAPTWSKR
ncbi:MAG: 30S ribosomal protein S9 [candidate division SR1 bacterium]|nr:MAG: 30S ribosomal protein S9 [candidate division SR1 bacterium]